AFTLHTASVASSVVARVVSGRRSKFLAVNQFETGLRIRFVKSNGIDRGDPSSESEQSLAVVLGSVTQNLFGRFFGPAPVDVYDSGRRGEVSVSNLLQRHKCDGRDADGQRLIDASRRGY